MTRILVTGATGFVGRSLVPALIQAGHQVRCAVSRQVDWLHTEQVVIRSLEHQEDWSTLLKDIDVVIHLAARVHIMREARHGASMDYYHVNSLATRTLAKQAAQSGVKRFIFLSSIKVNGESTRMGAPFTEAHTAEPQDPYGYSKLYAEDYLKKLSQDTGMDTVILRSPLVYGPEVKANFLKIMGLVHKRIPLPFGFVDNRRSFIYIDNLVSALCAVIDAPCAANQVYLVADDYPLSLTQLVELLAHGMNVKPRVFPVSAALLKTVFKVLGMKKLTLRLLESLEINNQKIKSDLDWMPPITPEEGIKKTAEWYKHEYIS